MEWSDYFHERRRRTIGTAEFLVDGVTHRQLDRACETGSIIRARPGYFVLANSDARIVEAVRMGGRLACTSAAVDYGVFGFEQGTTHVHLKPTSSRPLSSRDGRKPVSHGSPVLSGSRVSRGSCQANMVHWGKLIDPTEGNDYRVSVVDAIRQVFLCQDHRLAMAALENALYMNRLPEGAVPFIFSALPARLQYLRPLVDERSESGQETVLRLLLIEAGFPLEIQVPIAGVGRVDMVVNGSIVVEADSRQFHDGWEAHARDRSRDMTMAAQGYRCLRVLYHDIMFTPERIVLAVHGLLSGEANR